MYVDIRSLNTMYPNYNPKAVDKTVCTTMWKVWGSAQFKFWQDLYNFSNSGGNGYQPYNMYHNINMILVRCKVLVGYLMNVMCWWNNIDAYLSNAWQRYYWKRHLDNKSHSRLQHQFAEMCCRMYSLVSDGHWAEYRQSLVRTIKVI